MNRPTRGQAVVHTVTKSSCLQSCVVQPFLPLASCRHRSLEVCIEVSVGAARVAAECMHPSAPAA